MKKNYYKVGDKINFGNFDAVVQYTDKYWLQVSEKSPLGITHNESFIDSWFKLSRLECNRRFSEIFPYYDSLESLNRIIKKLKPINMISTKTYGLNGNSNYDITINKLDNGQYYIGNEYILKHLIKLPLLLKSVPNKIETYTTILSKDIIRVGCQKFSIADLRKVRKNIMSLKDFKNISKSIE